MKSAMKSGLRKGAGVVLILAGLVLMPLPILPGIPLVIAGAVLLLGKDHRWVRAAADWVRSKTKREAR